MAHHQQVVRIDKEKIDGLSGAMISRIVSYTKKMIKSMDAVIIEDYGKGVITPKLLKLVKQFNKDWELYDMTKDSTEEELKKHMINAINNDKIKKIEIIGDLNEEDFKIDEND